ncbi:MAG: PD-(D/E)XK motif protein [Williamsia sp.]|nr:PD-(D/E)XK motif protein [Williamsia sp.]
MIDYKKIWESINAESKNNPIQSRIARRIPTVGVFDVFLATDTQKGVRFLYVKLENDKELTVSNLPNFRGLEITMSLTSLGSFNNEIFLVFAQSLISMNSVFELFISDVCDKIIQLQDRRSLKPSVIKTLLEWQLFFEKGDEELLSIQAQKGLIGELVFLKDYLFQKYSFVDSILYWTGPDGANHDFQIHEMAIELKATSGKQHKKVNITSERQLDDVGIKHLYLSIFSVNLHLNMPEKTLPSFIQKIYILIQNDPIAIYHFQIKLAKYGYSETDKEKYKVGFTIKDSKFYEITEGFPRLLQKHLPNGVGDLKYTVVLSACTQYEITEDFLKFI